ncbi:MAG: globin domain-containing protein [Phenylobacterium sp.]|uniref:globin domain-containing protein n=1 Tax=Phenylobacterium sp. TaxID=1871053 RepID=UPI00391DDD8A
MSYSYSQAVEASLERVGELGVDPTAHVYKRLFAANPQMEALFWRDESGAIKGEMLARVFAAILDFVGERRYADHLIGTELVNHEGFDVPREVFATFFAVVRDTLRELLGADWSAGTEAAWAGMLADIDRFVVQAARPKAVA